MDKTKMNYPRLEDKLNRSKKLTGEDILKVKELRSGGELLKDIAMKFGVTPATILYHTSEERNKKVKRQSNIKSHIKWKEDKEYRKKSIASSVKSKVYKKEVSEEVKKYYRELSRKRYYANREQAIQRVQNYQRRKKLLTV